MVNVVGGQRSSCFRHSGKELAVGNMYLRKAPSIQISTIRGLFGQDLPTSKFRSFERISRVQINIEARCSCSYAFS